MTVAQHRILIVEDIPIAQKMAVMIMTKFGLVIDTANNGEKAIDQYRENEYSFILLDIGLPDIDGYEVTKIIRKMDKQRKDYTPIIALTAHLDSETQDKALGAGMDDFLSKPLIAESVRVILEKYLD